MDAILSDIHGNLEAINAVVADLKNHSIERIFNLGDTLGYGPNPVECLELSQRSFVNLLGNFDHAVLQGADGFCIGAQQSIDWSRSQILAVADSIARGQQIKFLKHLSPRLLIGNVLYVHGSPRNPLHEYLFPEDIFDEVKLGRISSAFDGLCFAGHTHIPGIFLEQSPRKWEFIYPEDCSQGFPVAGRRMICNVGAVGQPRDEDPRACYTLFDGERIWFRRVEYDLETTIRKIYAVPELINFIGDRLRDGR